MNYRKSVILGILAVTSLLLTACAGGLQTAQPIATTDNPVELVNQFDNEITTARKNKINVLSPTRFARAEKSLTEARTSLERGDEISNIFRRVAEGRAQLNEAEDMAQIAQTTLPDVIKSRDMARAAGATELDDYADTEEAFLALTKAIENNNLRQAQQGKARVANEFQDLELQAIKKETIGEVRKLIEQAEKEEAKKYAPESLAVAKKKLEDTDAFITQNPYEKEKMLEMSADALFYAQRLNQINAESKKIRDMESEKIALRVEELLHRATTALSAPDMRNEPLKTQASNIVGSISALEADHVFMIDKVQDQMTEIDKLKSQIQSLEGQSEEQRLAKERLAAEKEFNTLFTEIQQFFTADEAEVYKQGNQLVIRLKAMKFPVGKDVIMPDAYGLLSKVQRAIRTFGEPDLVIEGHTDSTGSNQVNEHLSQQRAQAVREYLIANRTLPAENIVAVGYGSMRPLASNESAEGRAINRRIDVIVKPQAEL